MNIFNKIKLFIEEAIAELKKVSWPTKKEIKDTTLVVIIAVFIFGLYLFAIDLILQWILHNIYKIFA